MNALQMHFIVLVAMKIILTGYFIITLIHAFVKLVILIMVLNNVSSVIRHGFLFKHF